MLAISPMLPKKQPAIIPIHYAGFKRFVVYKAFKDGRVYVADRALGNISFDQERFKQIWENNTLFLINVPTEQQQNLKYIIQLHLIEQYWFLIFYCLVRLML